MPPLQKYSKPLFLLTSEMQLSDSNQTSDFFHCGIPDFVSPDLNRYAFSLKLCPKNCVSSQKPLEIALLQLI